MKVYITKRALTKGIAVEDVESTDTASMVFHRTQCGGDCYHKPHWHMTWTAAVAQAEQMRVRKMFSLQRSLDKMKALSFPATEPKEKT